MKKAARQLEICREQSDAELKVHGQNMPQCHVQLLERKLWESTLR